MGRLVAVLIPVLIALALVQLSSTVAVSEEMCPSECSLDIVFVLDTSGSMSNPSPRAPGTLLDELKNATKTFINMTCEDGAWAIGIVRFSDTAVKLVDPPRVIDGPDDKAYLNNVVDSLTAGGATAIGDGILAGLEVVQNGRPIAPNALIVVSDGEHNAGIDPDTAASQARAQGVTLIGIFIGNPTGNGDEEMAGWADVFYNASDPSFNLTQVFMDISARLCEIVPPPVGGAVEAPAHDTTTPRLLAALSAAAMAVLLVAVVARGRP